MPKLIGSPTPIEAVGSKPKFVDEYVGLVNTGSSKVSIAITRSPGGWEDTPQCPGFHEYAVVLEGMLRVEYADGLLEAEAGSAVEVGPGEWIRYSTPREDGAEYLIVCVPAFSRAAVRREE